MTSPLFIITILITISNDNVLHQDFVDVTLACADGATIAAHKVILSSVSTYFRDILKVGGGEEQTAGSPHFLWRTWSWWHSSSAESLSTPHFILTRIVISECSVQAPHHHPQGHPQGGGPGDAGVRLHRGGEPGPEHSRQSLDNLDMLIMLLLAATWAVTQSRAWATFIKNTLPSAPPSPSLKRWPLKIIFLFCIKIFLVIAFGHGGPGPAGQL